MKINFNSYSHYLKLVKVYLLGVFLFSVFRLILFLTELENLSEIPSSERFSIMIKSFWMGIRFDTVISGYILTLPFVILTIVSFFKTRIKIVERVVFIYLFVLYSLAFLICSIDIPYFNHFFARFSITVTKWVESPIFILKMIFEEPAYWLIIIPFIVILIFFYHLLKKILFHKWEPQEEEKKLSFYLSNGVLSILFILLLFIGIRGRVEGKSPIRVGTAYFSNYAFANQLGLNPVFTLMRSYFDSLNEENKKINFLNSETAMNNVQDLLSINPINEQFPLARQINPDPSSPQNKYNVVVVMMESMSAAKMKRFGNTNNLTPFLDSIAVNGFCFDNIYSAGIHTSSGVYSTLFSYPILFRQHPMKGVNIRKFNGIAGTLKKHNYSTIYFTTHDGQFDNIEGFLNANDFDRVVTKADYPSEEIKSTLGVVDDFMFEFSIPILNELDTNAGRFFAAFLTSSDHGPYIIPEYFTPKQTDVQQQIIEYADWSLGKFIKLASMEDWFENTIFVFVADHGAALFAKYDMPLNYHHVPLIFYAPNILTESKIFTKVGGQIDIFPTIMGILNLPYVNNSFGIDLLRETRPFIYFSTDDKYGVINNEFYLIVRQIGIETLYKYRESDKNNYYKEYTDLVRSMKKYAESNMQAAQFILDYNKQYLEN
jgi:phosphoglycerol transferase MdoB-like AlkP superfamily enzyme